MPIAVTQLAHVCIFANDLAETRDFYRDVLGMEVDFNFTRNGAWYGFYLDAGGRTNVEVFLKPEAEYSDREPDQPPLPRGREHRRRRRAYPRPRTSMSPRSSACDDTWQAWITDPNGVRIELFEYTGKSAQFVGGDRDTERLRIGTAGRDSHARQARDNGTKVCERPLGSATSGDLKGGLPDETA